MIENIEQHLQVQYPGRWGQLPQSELERRPYRGARAGWRIEIDRQTLRIGNVDHLVVTIGAHFPNSQPTVFAPQAGTDFRWPHVEGNTKLCLIATQCAADPGVRVLDHLVAAKQLLGFSKGKCDDEFQREFLAYWKHRATVRDERRQCISIVKSQRSSRQIVCYFDAGGRIIFGEDRESLTRWLRNWGRNPSVKEIFPSGLLRLSRPWIPEDYPEIGQDLIKLLPEEVLRGVITAGRPAPLLIEVATATGPGFAAVVLEGAKEKDLSNGFRHITRVPHQRIVDSFAARPIQRIPVARADEAWIHGRDHNPAHLELMTKKVAIVGCGAVGAAVALLLAQAGVGELLLVDSDSLTTANVGRHPLGLNHVGLNKASALSLVLRMRYPHLSFESAFPVRFEELTRPDREKLAGADLIVTAGIDFDGEAALDAWRIDLPRPPALVSTWVEEFAAAGHAVLLYGKQSIRPAFDESERPRFRLTDWPEDAGALIVEAGCGNVFQPHGVVDLHPTVGMAAGLVVDALSGQVPDSSRRYWLGDRAQVIEGGGTPRQDFDESRVLREVPW
ncbi:ThiF family adenylyltransferase [Variovorax sp. EBFNA2]|uniref:ThiF family adenylyltransferase n=1 Tax=Variovorax sp. EBFNA2 TaxID=3342097 RepID=UPI0029BFEF1D|nr:ThiF family adenylyltransferase [Variovorax boronicumulans]WPG36217.1 ThiF family adenylyltransferase [Variovorax boronicumulans]